MNTLVDGVTYLVADEDGDAGGVYHGDTRHLQPMSVAVGDVDLTVLDETRRSPLTWRRRYTNAGTAVNTIDDDAAAKHATVVACREQTVREGRVVETFVLHNHRRRERTVEVVFTFDATFADVFEVRGATAERTRDVAATATDRAVTYTYEYTDVAGTDRTLETTVTFDVEPTALEPGRARFTPSVTPQSSWGVTATVTPEGDESTVRATDRPNAPESDHENASGPGGDGTRSPRVDPFAVHEAFETGSDAYDRVFAQACEDVRALTTVTNHGPVPLAGAPWFVTVFGRDALIASYFLLPVAPALAKGTLEFLAAHQGTTRDDACDERPGKILHEIRNGELARTGAIPQTPYYGSIDATPLWVTLLHETWRWTGDDDLVTERWEHCEAALDWLADAVARTEADPFLYYERLGTGGVVHKVWRDSAKGVQFADGCEATPPLASVAVQGYHYDALRRAADLARSVVDEDERASTLDDRADELAAAFDDAFWLPERECYAAALTTDGGPVDAVTSSVGHCLWSGIVPDARASTVADRLLADDLFSGWGLRTASATDAGYSPVSYHAGGVWPHDNALASLGLARYDCHEAGATIADGQLSAIASLDDEIAPELICGFDDGTPPTSFPSACRPQAWAAAAPFGFLRAVFDLDPDDIGRSRPAPGAGVLDATVADPLVAYWRTDE